MFKYNEFLLENLLTELLLESKIQFSKEFLKVLTSVGGKVADELKKMHGTEGEVTQNYIDINLDDHNQATFIQDRRAQQMMSDVPEEYQLTSDIHLKYEDFGTEAGERSNRLIYERLGMTFEDVNKAATYRQKLKITAETTARTSGNIYVAYQGIEDETLRGVVRKDRIALIENDVYDRLWTTSRNSMRVGRLARTLLRVAEVEHTDGDVEEFVNKYKAHIDVMNDAFAKFDVVQGDKISHWYNYDNYNLSVASGTLGNSCMAFVDSDFFDIYVVNPQVSLVILYDDNGEINEDGKYTSNKIIARAVLWETENGFKMMDRIYYSQDNLKGLFEKFAERNGWYYKVRHEDPRVVVTNGTTRKNEIITVKLDDGDHHYYPYLDTLMYLNEDEGRVSSSCKEIEANLCLNGTDGNDHESVDPDDYD